MTTENRETFLNRITPILPPSEILDIEVAYALIKDAHRGQERKQLDEYGNPVRYFEHLRDATLVLTDDLEIIERNLILGCMLHDTLEDTKNIHAQMIEHLFGKEVAQMVKLLTKNPKEGYYDRLMKHGTWQTLFVKGCDNLSNLRTLDGCSREFQVKTCKQSREKIMPLMGRLAFIAPELYRGSAKKLASLIYAASGKYI
jgi:(p)ppGpp synthase/HD superfamily hydrolase